MKNVKSLKTDGRTTDDRRSGKLIWVFSSGELKTKSWETKQNKLTKTSKLQTTLICQHKMTLLVSGWTPFLLAYSSAKWAYGIFCSTVIWCINYQLHAVTYFSIHLELSLIQIKEILHKMLIISFTSQHTFCYRSWCWNKLLKTLGVWVLYVILQTRINKFNQIISP